jgi:hypothetical protein
LIHDLGEERQEAVIGSWCLLTHDIDIQVSSTSLPSWEGNFGPGADPATEGALLIRGAAPALISFIRQVIFDPLGVYSMINPIQPSVDMKPVKKGAKPLPRVQAPPETPSTDEELDVERKARLRAGALGSVKYVLGMLNHSSLLGSIISHGWSCEEPASIERIFAGGRQRDFVQSTVVDIPLLWRTIPYQ